MRVLITGGTGFVGRAVTRAALEAGHQVIVGSRGGEALPGTEGVSLDVTDAQHVRSAVTHARPDAIVHLVGIIEERGAQTFERVHVDGTRNVLQAAPPGTRFVHMSALGAREGAPSAYGHSKGVAEQLVASSGLPFTVLRPSLIFGEGSDFFGRVLKDLVSKGPVVPLIGDGSFPFRPVSAHDVALAFTRALERPDTVGRRYDLTGPVEYTLRELLQLELGALGRRKPLVPVPLAVMNVLVPLMGVLPRPPITRDQYRMLLEGNTGDPEPAREAFELPLLPLEGALESIVRSRA